MIRNGLLIAVGVLALGALLTYWFFENFERTTETVKSDYSAEAIANPFLAAQRFSEAMGIPVTALETIPETTELAGSNQVLMIPERLNPLGAGRATSLLEWVRGGGHLIVAARFNVDDLLAAVDITPLDYRDINYESNDYDENTVGIRFPGTSDAMEIGSLPHWRFDAPRTLDELRLEDDYGVQALSRPEGAGRLTVFVSLDFLENWVIGEHDHAETLWHILHLHSVPTRLWLLHSFDTPPLWLWLWRRAPLVIATLTLLLLAWLAMTVRRFGPVQELHTPDRRRILEHIEASGRFSWKQKKGAALIHAVQRGLEQDIRKTHPGWSGYSAQQRVDALAALSDLPAQDINHAIHHSSLETTRDFTHAVHLLETIRKKL